MATELQYATDTPIWWWDRDGLVPSTASVALYGSDGSLLQSPTATISSVASTIASSGSTADAIVVASATGFEVGDWIAVVGEGVTNVARIVRIAATKFYLLSGLPAIPASGQAVKRLRISATVTALGETYLGRGLYTTWAYSGTGWSRSVRDAVEVVRSPWSAPCTAEMVRTALATEHQIAGATWGLCQSVADEANGRIRTALYASAHRPALFVGADAFESAAPAAIRWALALRGYGGGRDPILRESLRRDMDRTIGDTVSSLRPYDPLDSGVPNATPQLFSARGSR